MQRAEQSPLSRMEICSCSLIIRIQAEEGATESP
jgi:hypothetical protein